MTDQATTQQDSRRSAIVEAALRLFMAYGFVRVTMDDIAREAAMSRPALYQFFRNKQDIYEAGAAAMRENSLAIMELALQREGTPRQRICAAICEGLLDLMAGMEATPHGAELIGMSKALPPQWMAEWRDRKSALLAPVYAQAGARAPFDGETLAGQLSDYIEGMKTRIDDVNARRKALETFIALQFAALN